MKKSSVFAPVSQLGRSYFLLFAAGVLSDLGGFTTQTALVLHVYRLTGQNAAFMGLMALATLVPMVLAAPVGGVWAEKYNRRFIMVINDLLRIPLVLLMMFTESVAVLLLLQALVCASTALFMPSRQTLIPEVVHPDRLQLANALSGGVLSIVHILGPALGALLYARSGSLRSVVYIEAASYLFSAVLLYHLKTPLRPRTSDSDTPRGLWADIKHGLLYVRAEPDLWQIFMILVTAGMAIGLLIPLLRPFIAEVLSGNDHTYAMLIGSFGAGGLLGPLCGYWAGRRLGLGLTLTLCFVLEPLTLMVWSRISSVTGSAALLFLWGVNVFAMIPCYTSYLHTYARREYMGRTFALFDQSTYAPQILAAILVAVLGNRLPTQNFLTGAGAGYLLIVLLTFGTAGARLLRSRAGQSSITELPLTVPSDPAASARPE